MAKLLEINAQNPQERKLQEVVKTLKDGGIIIYPTDTVYGLGCDIFNPKAIERLCLIKGIKPKNAQFSIICKDIAEIAEYCRHLSNPVFKSLKRNLPGPYTYILEANNLPPKILQSKKKTIGVRIPNHPIAQEIARLFGNPIITTSIKHDGIFDSYPTDPIEIFEHYNNLVDLVIDGGLGGAEGSTIIDYTSNEPLILREGMGETSQI